MPGKKPTPKADKPPPRLIDQKGIQEEFGIMSRDVIRWCMSGYTSFPKPISIIGRKYIFHRDTILEYFKLKD